jgi:hypothetical protein
LRTFNFAFWNTALVPPKGPKKISQSSLEKACEIIAITFAKNHIDFMALCEVDEESLVSIETLLSSLQLTFCFINKKTETGGKFNLGYIYRSEKVSINEGITHTGMVGTSHVKIAQELIVLLNGTQNHLHVLISHWPSRLQYVAESLKKECSIGLRSFAQEIIGGGSQVIMMGDYNDDPYSESLFSNLRATNDRGLVIDNPSYWLYNPFWKTLSARVDFKRDVLRHDFGTCYSKSGNRNSWSSFDQIIFSGNFLTSGPWFLKESNTGIVPEDRIIEVIMDAKNKFDHLPIMGSIESNEVNNV